jgi:ATP-dependent DNA helicase RecQ
MHHTQAVYTPPTLPSVQVDLEGVRQKLQAIWGYGDFRHPQGEIVRALLEQQDALIVMPTGGGKSICFQLPALLNQGLTLVVSPLVALMENQVRELQHQGQPAALLHSELPSQHRYQIMQSLKRQQLRLLYLSPETLLSDRLWETLCVSDLKINGLILDEAHCLVQWGETFRPAYRRLGMVRPALLQHKPAGSQMAIAAFTATADPDAQRVIQETLQLHQPQKFLLNPYRPNLHLSAQPVQSPRGRRQRLLQFIQRHPQQSGLVYVRTRRTSEELADWLANQGYRTAAYHAGLCPEDRRQLETAWLQNDLQFVVCTSAFGMGINKPDVRWVVHFHAPLLLDEYVQEVGRAGRDGKFAEALTLISGWLDPEDRQRREFFERQQRSLIQKAQTLCHQLPREGNVKAIAREFREGAIALSILHCNGQLTWQDPFHYKIHAHNTQQSVLKNQGAGQMSEFLQTKACRWQFLLQAFGFPREADNLRCGHCDRCQHQQ